MDTQAASLKTGRGNIPHIHPSSPEAVLSVLTLLSGLCWSATPQVQTAKFISSRRSLTLPNRPPSFHTPALCNKILIVHTWTPEPNIHENTHTHTWTHTLAIVPGLEPESVLLKPSSFFSGCWNILQSLHEHHQEKAAVFAHRSHVTSLPLKIWDFFYFQTGLIRLGSFPILFHVRIFSTLENRSRHVHGLPMCACVFVCVSGNGEREKERDGELRLAEQRRVDRTCQMRNFGALTACSHRLAWRLPLGSPEPSAPLVCLLLPLIPPLGSW